MGICRGVKNRRRREISSAVFTRASGGFSGSSCGEQDLDFLISLARGVTAVAIRVAPYCSCLHCCPLWLLYRGGLPLPTCTHLRAPPPAAAS